MAKKFLIIFCFFLFLFELLTRFMEAELWNYNSSDEDEIYAKLYSFEHLEKRPGYIFIGPSRTAMTVNTRYINERYNACSYNWGLSGASIWTMRNMIQWVLDKDKKAVLVLGVDMDSFNDSTFELVPERLRIPKYLGLKYSLMNDLNSDIGFWGKWEMLEAYLTDHVRFFKFRSNWRNFIFHQFNGFLGRNVFPVVSKSRIANNLNDHGYDNATLRVDRTFYDWLKQSGNNEKDLVENSFKTRQFTGCSIYEKELRKIDSLLHSNQITYYWCIPPVLSAQYFKPDQIQAFKAELRRNTPHAKDILDFYTFYAGKDSLFMDNSHIRHKATYQITDSIYFKIRDKK